MTAIQRVLIENREGTNLKAIFTLHGNGNRTCRAMMTKSWHKITRGFIPRKIHRTHIQAGGH